MLCRIVVVAVLVPNILYIQCVPVGVQEDKIQHQIDNQTDIAQEQQQTQSVQSDSEKVQPAKRGVLDSKSENEENTAIKLTNLLFKGGNTLNIENNLRQTRQNQIQSNTQVQYDEASQQSSSKSSNVVVNQNALQGQVQGVPQVQHPTIPQPIVNGAAGIVGQGNLQQNQVQGNSQVQYKEASHQSSSKSSNVVVNQNQLQGQVQGVPQVQLPTIPQPLGNAAVGSQVQSNSQHQYDEASHQSASKSANVVVNQNGFQGSQVQDVPQIQPTQYASLPQQPIRSGVLPIERRRPYKGFDTLYHQNNVQARQNQIQSDAQYNEASHQSSTKSSNVVVNQNNLQSAGNGVVGIAQPYAAAPVQHGNAYRGVDGASRTTSQSAQYNEASHQSSTKSSNVVVNQNNLQPAGNGVVGIAQPYAAAPVQYGNVYTGVNEASRSTSQSTSQNVYSQQSSTSHANSNVVGSGIAQARSYRPKVVQNGDYHFGYTIDDDIRGGYNERQEQSKDGKVSGYYTYDDGHVWRKVVYEADEYGFRVLNDEILPSKKVGQPLTGVAYVKNHSGDGSYQYAITRDDTPYA